MTCRGWDGKGCGIPHDCDGKCPWRDDDAPDEHDCVTAAHLRDCGFCRAVLLGPTQAGRSRLDRVYETMAAMFEEHDFWQGSEPYRVWHDLPKVVIVPKAPPLPKPSRGPFAWIRRG